MLVIYNVFDTSMQHSKLVFLFSLSALLFSSSLFIPTASLCRVSLLLDILIPAVIHSVTYGKCELCYLLGVVFCVNMFHAKYAIRT